MRLDVRNVRKQIDGVPILQGVDLTLTNGVTVLLGPNGAGKTTLLRVLAGILAPDDGALRCDGRPLDLTGRAWHAQLGYVPQAFDFVPGQTLATFLRYIARLKGLPDRLATVRVAAALTLTGLAAESDRAVSDLSGGQRRLAGLAQALLASPKVLLLDEPTVGLDPEVRQQILSILTLLGRERIVLVSTHIAADAEALDGYLLLLVGGRAVSSGTVATLLAAARGHVWEKEVAASELAAFEAKLSGSLAAEKRVGAGRVRLRVVGEPPTDGGAVLVEPGLEEAYLYALAQAKRAATSVGSVSGR